MFILLILLVLARGNWITSHLESLAAKAVGFDVSDTCGFTRADALECIKKHVDFDKNQRISCEEFVRAKALFLPPRLRILLSMTTEITGWDIKFESVLWGCDGNRDCVFDVRGKNILLLKSLCLSFFLDWDESKKTCLPGKSDLCKLETACNIAKDSKEEFTPDDWKKAKATCAPFTMERCRQLENGWDKAAAEDEKKNSKSPAGKLKI